MSDNYWGTQETPEYDKTGMTQINVNSGHKQFDRQTASLMVGNVTDNTYCGWFIRPSTELECNGFINSPGHLQNFDFKIFEGKPLFSRLRSKFSKLVDENMGGILYCFWHNYYPELSRGWRGTKRGPRSRFYHGYILTTTYEEPTPYRLLGSWVIDSRVTSFRIIQAVIPFLTRRYDK